MTEPYLAGYAAGLDDYQNGRAQLDASGAALVPRPVYRRARR